MGGGITPGPHAPHRGPPVSRGRFTPEGRAHRLCSPKNQALGRRRASTSRALYQRDASRYDGKPTERGEQLPPKTNPLHRMPRPGDNTRGRARAQQARERESGAPPAVSQTDYPVSGRGYHRPGGRAYQGGGGTYPPDPPAQAARCPRTPGKGSYTTPVKPKHSWYGTVCFEGRTLRELAVPLFL